MRLVAATALAWGSAYLVWRIGWSGRGAAPVRYWLLLGAELFGFASLALYAWQAWRVPPMVRPASRGGTTVDVLVCTYDEPIEVLEATLAGCRALAYPHVTHLLDDGRRVEVAALARRMGVRYVTRPDNRHAKAGNLNHALGVTDGELILALDADHVPRADFLDVTVGYFDDPTVALVQTPHDFSNRDSFQHPRPHRHEQSLFYDVVAPGKNRHNAMFWCGSAAVIRRAALEDVGGVRTSTVAEDFHTTIAMHARGWRTRYHHETLVQGLAPHDLGSFLLQRARWARGNLRVFTTKENPVWCRGLTPWQRLSYLTSLLNYFSGVQRLVLLGILVSTLLTGRLPMTASLAALGALWLPWAVLSFTATLALARGALGPAESTVYGLETMGIYVRAAVGLAWPRVGRFRVTPKASIDRGGVRALRSLGLLTAVGVVLVVSVVLRGLEASGVVELPPMGGLALVITLALGLYELAFIGRTLVPVVRRRQLRARYRFPVQLRARVAGTERTIVTLHDLSPTGVSFASPLAWKPGARVGLLTRLPDAFGTLKDIALSIEVRACTWSAPERTWRVGGELVDVDPATHALLVDYCYVYQPRDRFGASQPRESAGSGGSVQIGTPGTALSGQIDR